MRGLVARRRVGDTITHVNGARIADRSAADAMTLLKQAGAEFSLVVERAGQVQQMSGGLSQAEPSGEGIGITLVTGGAFKSRSAVTSVKPGSLGDRAGLQAGDVIASVNGTTPLLSLAAAARGRASRRRCLSVCREEKVEERELGLCARVPILFPGP